MTQENITTAIEAYEHAAMIFAHQIGSTDRDDVLAHVQSECETTVDALTGVIQWARECDDVSLEHYGDLICLRNSFVDLYFVAEHKMDGIRFD